MSSVTSTTSTSSSSSSSSSTSSTSTKRITGLASGLDTESLVTALTSDIQTKIDEANQKKQVLEWIQEDYETIATNLNNFYNQYFSTSSSIVDKLKQLTSSSSNTAYVTATANSGATSGSVYIDDIKSLATAAKLQSSSTVSPKLSFTVDTDNLSELSGSSFNITLDGVTKTITFGSGTYSSSDDVATALQTLVDNTFGEGRITVTSTDGKLSIDAENSKVSIADTSTSTDTQALGILGFDSSSDVSSNRISTGNTTLASLLSIGTSDSIGFSINGQSFSFTGSTTLSSVMAKVNSSSANVTMSYSDITDKFTITSKQTGVSSSITLSDTSGSFLSTVMGSGYGTLTKGTDAVVSLSLDGSTDSGSLITITRSSNTFSINGVSYTLNSMAAGNAKEQVSIKTALNTDTLKSTIKSFVEDYNTLLKSITDKLNEKKYSNYKPLTDTQKENMSDTDIEKWTNYAKSGLLRNDTYLTEIYNQLRSCMYSSVYQLTDNSKTTGLILSDIGITTGNYTSYGQLTIDDSALTTAISQNPDGVLQLFTQSSSVAFSLYNTSDNATKRTKESGLMYKLSDILKANLSTIGKKGSLITLVGNPSNQFIGKTTYSKKIQDVESLISDLEDKLSSKQEYYWKKFTAMETAINSMNSKASWLSQSSSS